MCEFLDTFDLESVDEDTLSKMITSVSNFLSRAETHYTNQVMEMSFKSASETSPKSQPKKVEPPNPLSTPDIPSSITSRTEYHQNVLDPDTLQELKTELKQTVYHRTGDNKAPEVCLYGDNPYSYNRATKQLKPVPFTRSPVISKVLEVINSNYGGDFNSVLINKYRTKNVVLGWHKDDEAEVDNTSPIISLSLGATRRFSISDSKEKHRRCHSFTQLLRENDVFVMKAGIQNSFYHQVEKGRDSVIGECGIRYSLTFRHIRTAPHLSSVPSPTYQSNPMDHTKCVSAMVFGSSLTKGLKENLLSQGGERVKVYPHPGAWVNDVKDDIDNVLSDKEICSHCIKSIFLVVGGNQVENARSPQHFEVFLNDYNDLLGHISKCLPHTKINAISLIPRRSKDGFHDMKMLRANEKLFSICKPLKNCRFINIFSHYLVNKKGYFNNRVILLNEKLYVNDMLHFSKLGNSVLGKVLKGVIYRPIDH